MFKKSHRFSFRKGAPRQKLVTHLFILRFQKSEIPTYAVVAGKVVSKKAVLRNTAKRTFIASLKETLEKTPNSYDLVFFLRRPFVEYQKSVIMGELENSIKRINT